MVESGKSVSDVKKMFEQNIASQEKAPLKPIPGKLQNSFLQNQESQSTLHKQNTEPPKKLVSPFLNNQAEDSETKQEKIQPKKLVNPFQAQLQAQNEIKKPVEPPKKLEPVQPPPKVVATQMEDPEVKKIVEPPKKLVNPFENQQQDASEIKKPVDQPKKLINPFLQQDEQPKPANDKPPIKMPIKHAITTTFLRRHSSDEEDKKPEPKPQPKKLDPMQLKQAETIQNAQAQQVTSSQSTVQQQEFKNSLEVLLAKQRANPNNPNARRQTTQEATVEKEKIKMDIFNNDDEEKNFNVQKPVINKKRAKTVKFNVENFDF